jgi:hypothetical protein
MRESDAWDDHTREIVFKRLNPVTNLQHLDRYETEIFTSITAVLIDDQRTEILSYISSNLDQHLQSKIGESQRKTEIPTEAVLIRKGLAAIAETAKNDYGKKFHELTLVERQTMLGKLERQEYPNSGLWQEIPQKELFKKLLGYAVDGYYSHPVVWSEIGYAGPAYPRGYVRTELNLTDPWEAQPEKAVSQKE